MVWPLMCRSGNFFLLLKSGKVLGLSKHFSIYRIDFLKKKKQKTKTNQTLPQYQERISLNLWDPGESV